jgi:hypothetical protein
MAPKVNQKDIEKVLSYYNNMRVPYYLMLSYLYYEKDISIVSDGFFDNMAKDMLSDWENISHMHKHLITTDMLEAGTYLGEYPLMVQDSAEALVKNGLKEVLKKLKKRSVAVQKHSPAKPSASEQSSSLESFFK